MIIHIEGMSCDHCVSRVQKALDGLGGAKKVKVNLEDGRTEIIYDDTLLDMADIEETIDYLGYKLKEKV
ncbi:MAG: heavy-metal-associated domain-containing protein [Firmicutes bacterium]|nr:heavy-metal-associated domain-containing protein [Bacillota bacterium]